MKPFYTLVPFSKNLTSKKIPVFIILLFFTAISSFGQGASCGTAEAITISVGNTVCDASPGTTSDTVQNPPNISGCAGSTFKKEGWYSFTITGGPLDITITAANSDTRNLYLQLMSSTGACAGRTEIACANNDTSNSAQTETISMNPLGNGTYYVKVVDVRTNGNTNMNIDSFCITAALPPCNTPNVTAATAITTTTATINWTAATPVPANGYQYVVSTSNTVPAGAGTADAGSPANITGLTSATAYYVFVRSDCGGSNFSGWDGPISFITATPTNDEPCSATPLTSNASCIVTNDTTVGATHTSGIPNPVCGLYQNSEPDVWFTTTVGASGAFQVDAFDIGVMDPVIAVYSATNCSGPFTLVDCDDDAGAGLDSQLIISGRTPGEVLYIRVWEYQGNNNGPFNICVTTIADPCASITNIASCGATIINATIASGNGAFNDSCVATPGAEQVFSFTPGVSGNYSITQLTTFDHINYSFNTTCGPTGWDCFDDLTGNNQTSSFFNLTAGTTYYILLDSENTTGGNVTFTLNCPPSVPPNDLCSNAITLDCGDTGIAGTTNGSTNITHNTGCAMSNYGVWYSFIGDDDQTTIFVDAETGFDLELSVSEGTCGSLTNITCRDTAGAGGIESYTFITAIGTRYFVYIANTTDGASSTLTGNFTISRSCLPVIPPPNDDTCGAIDLIVNAQCVPTAASNQFASSTLGIANPTCSTATNIYNGGDIWFTVTVPPSPGREITIETLAGVITNLGTAVYSGSITCSPEALTLNELACSYAGSITLDNAINGITAGQILYIRVWENGNDAFGSFGICVTAPTTNNFNVALCQGDPSKAMATALFCTGGGVIGGDITGAVVNGSPQTYTQPWGIESDDPCAFETGNPNRNRRYDVQTFMVTDTGTYVFTIDDATTTIYDTMGYIYETGTMSPGGPCSAGYIAGDDDSGIGLDSVITAYLQAGVSYTLVTTSALIPFFGGTDTGTYTWSTGATPAPAQWWDASTGGTLLGEGSYFDPVAANAIPDTDTPGVYTYWVGCPNDLTRTETTYTIYARPSGTISGASSGGSCGSYEITITVTDGVSTNFNIRYQIDDGGTITTTDYNGSSPYVFTATAPIGSIYTLLIVQGASSNFCDADPVNLTGSATVTTASPKTWVGNINSDWTNGGNWAPPGEPTLSDCVIIPNSGSNSDPQINGAYDNAEAGSLTVQNGGYLLVLAGGTITVQDVVTIDAGGTFELEGANGGAGGSSSSISANLVQINDTAVNSGTITQERATWVRRQDYVYWSSPVENYNTSTISGTQYIYDWRPTIFVNPTTQFGNWNSATNTIMDPGKGYIVRGPSGNGNSNTTASWNLITFNGTPHNGIYQPVLQRGTFTTGSSNGNNNGDPGDDDAGPDEDNWNLVGNPYPSNLDVDAFLAENAQNNTRIDGVVYLWSHGTEIRRGNSPFFGDYAFSYDETDYIAYNYLGTPNTGYDGIIGSGQGFFVLMEDSSGPPSNTPVGTQVGSTDTWEIPITFNNSMRIGSDEQFFRTAQSRPSNLNRHRIWLSLVQPSDNVSTLLIGYAEGATIEKDKMFDAKFMSGSSRKLYSIIENDDHRYVIQGRGLPFEDSDRVPLGIIIDQDGEYAINLEDVDGLFNGINAQNIYVEDLDLGVIHNLTESPYFFTPTEMGEFTNRFAIRYTTNSLGLDEFNLNTGIVIMAPNSDYIKITSSNNTIESVLVYDLLGRKLIDRNNINSQELVLNKISSSDGILMVKVTLTNGQQKIQKVVLRH